MDYSIFNAENELCKSLSCNINNKLSSLICFFYSYINASLYIGTFNISNNFTKIQTDYSRFQNLNETETNDSNIKIISSFIKDLDSYLICRISFTQIYCIAFNNTVKEFIEPWGKSQESFCNYKDNSTFYLPIADKFRFICNKHEGNSNPSEENEELINEINRENNYSDNFTNYYFFHFNECELTSNMANPIEKSYICEISPISKGNFYSETTQTYIEFLTEIIKPIEPVNIESTFIEAIQNTDLNNNSLPKEIINMPKNISKEDIIDYIDNIMDNITIGTTYEVEGDDFSLLIYPTNSTALISRSHVNFEKCENILREFYHLPNSTVITFFQIELQNNNSKSLINQVEYKVYDEKKKELNLTLCNESNIQVFYLIKNDSDLDISEINSFKDSGVNVFDINDNFFTDVCHPYSTSSGDMILEDRIKYIYQNYSLCEDGCTFSEIFLENIKY